MNFMWREGLKGLWVGALLGGLFGLSFTLFYGSKPFLFLGECIVLGAFVCGLLGFLMGETFFEWLKENWFRIP
jgi:hypothetical protein